ncbi:hypothetical protein MHBO_000503 [Bonamia ostreae]|uniref:Uncharacterized protein n=1 Tax=Bonamia ostreae TaxID=126728 RepID=A0ABV2AGN4_9EUKA
MFLCLDASKLIIYVFDASNLNLLRTASMLQTDMLQNIKKRDIRDEMKRVIKQFNEKINNISMLECCDFEEKEFKGVVSETKSIADKYGFTVENMSLPTSEKYILVYYNNGDIKKFVVIGGKRKIKIRKFLHKFFK